MFRVSSSGLAVWVSGSVLVVPIPGLAPGFPSWREARHSAAAARSPSSPIAHPSAIGGSYSRLIDLYISQLKVCG